MVSRFSLLVVLGLAAALAASETRSVDPVTGIESVSRGQHPWPQFDTYSRLHPPMDARPHVWQMELENGHYPVFVVMGDCASLEQTNNIKVGGVRCVDPDPYIPGSTTGYNRGDFDGYAVDVDITDGKLTIEVDSGEWDPKLCFVEIGKKGSVVTPEFRDKLDAQIARATQRTAGPAFPPPLPNPRTHVYSDGNTPALYVANSTKYYVSTDPHGTPTALTNNSGVVAERYKYDAYGERTTLTENGTPVGSDSTVAFECSYTGLQRDRETGLLSAQRRVFDPRLGRWISRDPIGYIDGMNLYQGYFIPNSTDPTGLYAEAGHFYTSYLSALAAGMTREEAYRFASWSQYPDENPQYDAMRAGGWWGVFSERRRDVQTLLHSLTGGDAEAQRSYIACLMKNGHLTADQKGVLAHTLGDSYAHTYIDATTGRDTLYPPYIGHLLAGHHPDFIASDPVKYWHYVDQLYGLLKSDSNNRATHDDWIEALKEAAANLPQPTVLDDLGLSEGQNLVEVKTLRGLLGGFHGPEHPEEGDFPEKFELSEREVTEMMTDLMNKIRAGSPSACCQGGR